MNAKKKTNHLLVSLIALASGCKEVDPTPHIIDMGIVVFLTFGFVILITLLLPRLQQTRIFERIRLSIRMPSIIAAVLLQIFGIFLIIRFITSSDIVFLYTLVGAVMVIGGFFLRRWATKEPDKQSTDLKVVALSISFALAILWLIFYAAKALRF